MATERCIDEEMECWGGDEELSCDAATVPANRRCIGRRFSASREIADVRERLDGGVSSSAAIVGRREAKELDKEWSAGESAGNEERN